MNIKKRILQVISILMIAIMMLIIPAGTVKAADKYDKFSVSLNAGYGDKLFVGYGAPFYITITNGNSANFDGWLQLIIPNFEGENILYEQEFSIGAGEVKTVEIDAEFPVPAKQVNVRLTNKKGKVLWYEYCDVTFSKTMNEVRVGVLSDDFTALAYMDRQHFLKEDTISTSLIELDKDTLSEDYQAMETLDVIVISDFSTDLLTKEQIGALNLWIQNGGFLVIGTGSTGNKTMAGVNGSIINATLDKKGDKTTTLGQSIRDYSYLNLISTNGNSDRDRYLEWVFYQNYYYMTFDDYALLDYDYDNDGIADEVYSSYMVSKDGNGNMWDQYGNKIDPSNQYLFDEKAVVTDPIGGNFYYKYYDERYCKVPSDDEGFELFYDSNIVDDYMQARMFAEYCNVWKCDPKFFLYDQENITSEADLEAEFDKYFGADYENFTRHWMYGYYQFIFNSADVFNDLTQGQNSTGNVNGYSYISVDTSEYIVDGTEYQIMGDDKDGSEYPIANIIPRGEGYIAVVAVDFTKNPMPKTAYSGEFFRDLVQEIIGVDFITKSNDYNSLFSGSLSYFYAHNYNNYSYRLDDLIRTVSGAPLPPMLMYGIILLVYFIAIIVLYIVFSVKKKTYSLWKVFPITMVVLALTIFVLGFSTRIMKLNINIVSLIKPNNGISQEKDIVAAVIPRKKEYSVKFDNEVKVDKSAYLSTNNYYSYNTNIEPDLNKYTTVYRLNYDSTEGVISNKAALDSRVFKADAVYPTQGGLDIEYIVDPNVGGYSASNIRITNHYSTDLEDLIIVMFDNNGDTMNFQFNNIKAGESVVASTGSNYSNGKFTYTSRYSSYGLDNDYDTFNMDKILLGTVVGETSKGVRNYIKRKQIIKYVMYDELSYDSASIMVMAFPKTTIGAKVTEQKNCKINRYEVILINKYLYDIDIAGNN